MLTIFSSGKNWHDETTFHYLLTESRSVCFINLKPEIFTLFYTSGKILLFSGVPLLISKSKLSGHLNQTNWPKYICIFYYRWELL